MSEVTTTSSSRSDAFMPRSGRQASPDSPRQAGSVSGKGLPPSVSKDQSNASIQSINTVEASAEKVSAAVAQMNEYIQSTQRDLRFSIDRESGETIVKVLDRQTQEVIRQIPDDVFLKLAQNLSVNEPVHFFSEQA